MSSSINVYVVDVERLQQVLGSCDQATVDAVLADHEGFLSSIDDINDKGGAHVHGAVNDRGYAIARGAEHASRTT